ncbi:hypothetical protein ACP70R_020456 [Stipagrostis hirtigluma subsp. patula]
MGRHTPAISARSSSGAKDLAPAVAGPPWRRRQRPRRDPRRRLRAPGAGCRSALRGVRSKQRSGFLDPRPATASGALALDKEYWKAFICHNLDNESAPPGSSLSLSIEEDSSHREAKFIFFSKLAGVEMIPEGWYNYILPALLLEEHKNKPVDTNIGFWALISYELSACNFEGIWLSTKNKWNME